MKIRNARMEDLSQILEIYQDARRFMAENGNPDQWGDGYPPRELLLEDLEKEQLYVCEGEGELQAVFVFSQEEDPSYRKIYQGQWKNDLPYGVIHRIASGKKGKGTASVCLDWCLAQCKNLRIDTHRRNIPMQSFLKKKGFQECGVIYIEDGSERLAFQKTE
ncbi:MAG: GNAT family N-acetyltransferase [Eubacteriales bacterium]|nr:GNAT family N-acetyltransferase [Eubacteriales bacterium]